MRVAILSWSADDGIAKAFETALAIQGALPRLFVIGDPIPEPVDLVLSFAPYGRLTPLMTRLVDLPLHRRPRWLHWSMECFPSLGVPWPLLSRLARLRSQVDTVGERLARHRFLGEYLRALDAGLMTRLVESSNLHAQIYQAHGYDVPYVPWGMPSAWQADMELERDIDVLWMGKRRTRRRARWLGLIRAEIEAEGLHMYVADGEERPFVFGQERIRLLNRARVTLNLLPRSYDTAFTFRFVHAAANGSLVVSEPNLPHCPEIEPGQHYVAAEPRHLSQTILRCLRMPEAQAPVVAAARSLVRKHLTMQASLARILDLTA